MVPNCGLMESHDGNRVFLWLCTSVKTFAFGNLGFLEFWVVRVLERVIEGGHGNTWPISFLSPAVWIYG